MQPIESKILNRIYGNGRGWSFIKNDFTDFGSANAIDKALSRLVKKSRIRRVIRGVYDYPRYSKLLDKALGPDIDQVARALARKFGWKIQVSGNTALNVLGLSPQVPGRYVYLSDGKNAVYHIGNRELNFKKTGLKEIGLKYPSSTLLVQAIKALNKRQLDIDQCIQIRAYFTPQEVRRILKETKYTTSWIYEIIKEIFRNDD